MGYGGGHVGHFGVWRHLFGVRGGNFRSRRAPRSTTLPVGLRLAPRADWPAAPVAVFHWLSAAARPEEAGQKPELASATSSTGNRGSMRPGRGGGTFGAKRVRFWGGESEPFWGEKRRFGVSICWGGKGRGRCAGSAPPGGGGAAYPTALCPNGPRGGGGRRCLEMGRKRGKSVKTGGGGGGGERRGGGGGGKKWQKWPRNGGNGSKKR